jgi:hypothetical protein
MTAGKTAADLPAKLQPSSNQLSRRSSSNENKDKVIMAQNISD